MARNFYLQLGIILPTDRAEATRTLSRLNFPLISR